MYMKNLYKTAETLSAIDIENLYDAGKRFIIIDLDNTIARWKTFIIKDDAREWLRNAKEKGFDLK